MTEATVRKNLLQSLKTQIPTALALRYEDRYTKGLPDVSVSYNGQTSFWELKYADPYCATSKVQHYMCSQLDLQGFHCRYVIFQRGIARAKNPRPRQIRIVKPDDFDQWQHLGLVLSDGCFDYSAFGNHILKLHG